MIDIKFLETIMLVLLIAVVPFLYYLNKKTSILSKFKSKDIKMLGGLQLGAKEKVLLLEVKGIEMLVGVTQHNITMLRKFKNIGNDNEGKVDELKP